MSKLRKKFVDDSLDAFAVHGTAGFLGVILVGVFADEEIMNLGLRTAIWKGGWVSKHFI
jgi:ammonia channel protein AmtB